jgi:hypothetical protein
MGWEGVCADAYRSQACSIVWLSLHRYIDAGFLAGIQMFYGPNVTAGARSGLTPDQVGLWVLV